MAMAQTAGQDDDYAEHWQDYRHFVRTVQFMVAGIATILVLLAYFLSRVATARFFGSEGGRREKPSAPSRLRPLRDGEFYASVPDHVRHV